MSDGPNTPPTPREYFEAMALPTLAEFLAEPVDRRRAYLACLVIYHCTDSVGLAEAASTLGFASLSKTKRKAAVDTATASVRDKLKDRCGSSFTLVQELANGTKHPGRLPLLPGSERHFPGFAWDTEGAGWDEGRWEGEGLAVETAHEVLFLDTCARQVLAAFVSAYPQHLSGVPLALFIEPGWSVPGFDMAPQWLSSIVAWAAGKPEVAEVWLFGSRAKGTARPDSDVDLGIVLVPGQPGHDWPLGNYSSRGDQWEADLSATIGQDVHLKVFARPGEQESDNAVFARASAVLLWRRKA